MSVSIYTGEDIWREEDVLKNNLKKQGIDQDHIVMIDASDRRNFRMDAAIMECDTFSLFDEGKKAVILKDPYFLMISRKKGSGSTTGKKKDDPEAQIERILTGYLNHPNPATELIFYCHGSNAAKSRKITKLLLKYGASFIEFNMMDEKEFRPYAEQELKKRGFQLSTPAFNELMDRTGNDNLLFHNALAKMELYGEKDLDRNDITHLVSLNPKQDTLKFVSSFMNGDLAGCLSVMQEMKNASYSVQAMISMIAKRIRSVYNMKLLHEKGQSEDEISTRMNVKRGYVWYVLKDYGSVSARALLRWLKELADLDQQIKQGKTDPDDGFDRFILTNCRKQNAGYRRTYRS